MTEDSPEEAARKLFAGACDFVWGSTTAENLPPEKLNEVAFVGRSNAGKSSLVNALTGRKALARVSQTPGATRQINFFNLADRLMLVDLPGYGFAKRSKTESEAWQEMIFSYLRRRSGLRSVLMLTGARRGGVPAVTTGPPATKHRGAPCTPLVTVLFAPRKQSAPIPAAPRAGADRCAARGDGQ